MKIRRRKRNNRERSLNRLASLVCSADSWAKTDRKIVVFPRLIKFVDQEPKVSSELLMATERAALTLWGHKPEFLTDSLI